MTLPRRALTLDVLIDRLKNKTPVSHIQAEVILRSLVDILEEESASGEMIDLRKLLGEKVKSKNFRSLQRARP